MEANTIGGTGTLFGSYDHLRQDLGLLIRAFQKGWPIPDVVIEAAPGEIAKMAFGKDRDGEYLFPDKTRLKAHQLLIMMDRANTDKARAGIAAMQTAIEIDAQERANRGAAGNPAI